jgi:hypothetical protein
MFPSTDPVKGNRNRMTPDRVSTWPTAWYRVHPADGRTDQLDHGGASIGGVRRACEPARARPRRQVHRRELMGT